MSQWKEYKLSDIANIYDEKRIPLSKLEREKRQGKFPYYGASGIIDYVDDFLFDGEFVLISEDGENLKTRQTPIAFKAKGQFWVNNHAHIIKGENYFVNDLIVYTLQNTDLHPFLTGAVQPKLNQENLLEIPFFLPEDEFEQRAIASVLSSLDDKIDLLNRQNKTLEAMAETLFRQWFVEEAEEGWATVKLGDYIRTNIASIDKTYSIKNIRYLDTGSLTEGKIEYLQHFDLTEAPSRARRIVRHNDILISTVRPNQKHYGIIKQPEEDIIVSTGFCVVNCDRINPHFVYVFLTTNEMTEYLHTIAEGSTSTYPSLKPSDIEMLEFQMPPQKKT
ncbi:MAG TPA: restriction endonuclease subunit S [Chitinispirillaceae bacterium]|nr:restriction endonuclease subunit S [Chitinispirillaceae bacterium]